MRMSRTKPIDFEVKIYEVIHYIKSRITDTPMSKPMLMDWREDNAYRNTLGSKELAVVPRGVYIRVRFYVEKMSSIDTMSKFVMSMVEEGLMSPQFRLRRAFRIPDTMYVDLDAYIMWDNVAKKVIEQRLRDAEAKVIAITWMGHRDMIPEKFRKLFFKYKNELSKITNKS